MNTRDVHDAFLKTIVEFVEYRKHHGGIMLPDSTLLRNEFDKAMVSAGVDKPRANNDYMIVRRKTE